MEEIKKNLEIGLKLIKECEKVFEIWKPINNYDNYEVSSFGRVKNTKTGRIMKLTTDTHGYNKVNLSNNGKIITFIIHKLIASTFIKNPKCYVSIILMVIVRIIIFIICVTQLMKKTV